MSRIPLPGGEREEIHQLFSLAPHVSRPASQYSAAVYEASTLPMRLRELCRMRIADINQCVV